MNDDTAQSTVPAKPTGARGILFEAITVALIGATVAFAANWLSPRGLVLTRNYFPVLAKVPTPAPVITNSAPGTATAKTNPPSAIELLAAQLRAEGLQPLDGKQAEQLFRDPRHAQGLVAFIDARNDKEYQAGHIPGAYQFDHYQFVTHPAQWLPPILPVCQMAQQIVVYCNGGDCSDSLFAAKDLSDAQVPKEKLYVYEGGITEWATNGLPIEVGARLSGQLRGTAK